MKEDVLEQIADDYFMHQGYFTRHNVRFKPAKDHVAFVSNQDSVASDIDVIAINPNREGTDRVWVASCKSWQAGFDPAKRLKLIRDGAKVSGRPAWMSFRELCEPKWAEGLVAAIKTATGQTEFTHVTVITKLLNKAGRQEWEGNERFAANIGGNPIKILTLSEMLDTLWPALTTTPAASEIGRAIQLMKAAMWKPPG